MDMSKFDFPKGKVISLEFDDNQDIEVMESKSFRLIGRFKAHGKVVPSSWYFIPEENKTFSLQMLQDIAIVLEHLENNFTFKPTTGTTKKS